MGVLLALAAMLSTRLVYAAPAQMSAELTAISHCTQHKGRPASVPDARRCCQITADADSPATRVAAGDVPVPQWTALPAIPAAPAIAPAPAPSPNLPVFSTRDGPPRYLSLLSIRR
jgi:hypothetical protein